MTGSENQIDRDMRRVLLCMTVGMILLSSLLWWLCHQEQSDVTTAAIPAVEIAATKDATETVKKSIDEAQNIGRRLPGVVERAKDKAIDNIGALSDDGVAERWNGLLDRYREGRTKAGGLAVE